MLKPSTFLVVCVKTAANVSQDVTPVDRCLLDIELPASKAGRCPAGYSEGLSLSSWVTELLYL
jgi:hypothetical protein